MQRIGLSTSAIALGVLVFFFGAATVHGFGVTTTIGPSGGDDTPEIQAALDSCVDSGKACVVQLQAGLFRVSGLQATGFRGSLRGTGIDETTLLAAGSGATSDLMRFVDSDVTISDLEIRLPSEIEKPAHL